ncbi:MAG: hypothetical protein H6707_18740 [Deltaproteobacteria bacterium]|nr:hypothetical protein [Deltaproteobacteria bacterium]
MHWRNTVCQLATCLALVVLSTAPAVAFDDEQTAIKKHVGLVTVALKEQSTAQDVIRQATAISEIQQLLAREGKLVLGVLAMGRLAGTDRVVGLQEQLKAQPDLLDHAPARAADLALSALCLKKTPSGTIDLVIERRQLFTDKTGRRLNGVVAIADETLAWPEESKAPAATGRKAKRAAKDRVWQRELFERELSTFGDAEIFRRAIASKLTRFFQRGRRAFYRSAQERGYSPIWQPVDGARAGQLIAQLGKSAWSSFASDAQTALHNVATQWIAFVSAIDARWTTDSLELRRVHEKSAQIISLSREGLEIAAYEGHDVKPSIELFRPVSGANLATLYRVNGRNDEAKQIVKAAKLLRYSSEFPSSPNGDVVPIALSGGVLGLHWAKGTLSLRGDSLDSTLDGAKRSVISVSGYRVRLKRDDFDKLVELINEKPQLLQDMPYVADGEVDPDYSTHHASEFGGALFELKLSKQDLRVPKLPKPGALSEIGLAELDGWIGQNIDKVAGDLDYDARDDLRELVVGRVDQMAKQLTKRLTRSESEAAYAETKVGVSKHKEALVVRVPGSGELITIGGRGVECAQANSSGDLRREVFRPIARSTAGELIGELGLAKARAESLCFLRFSGTNDLYGNVALIGLRGDPVLAAEKKLAVKPIGAGWCDWGVGKASRYTFSQMPRAVFEATARCLARQQPQAFGKHTK